MDVAARPTHMWALFDADCDTPRQRLVLLALVTYAQKHGIAWPSQATLARVTGLHRVTVARTLAELEAKGLIFRSTPGQAKGSAVRWSFPDSRAVPVPKAAQPVDFQDRADLAKRRLRAYEREQQRRA